jgi:hypothetical protein
MATRQRWIAIAALAVLATAAHAADLRAVVVRRDASGHADLRVDENSLREHGSVVAVHVIRACTLDPQGNTWRTSSVPVSRTFKLATLDEAKQGERIVYAPREAIGLVWIEWYEQDERRQRRDRATFLVSGPILCNDVAIHALQGTVAVCVPFANRAEARAVPDPATTCR